jgi:hypothetical protein
MCNSCHFFNINNVNAGIAYRFNINSLGLFVNGFFEILNIIGINEYGFDAEPRKGVGKEVVGPTI